MREFSRSHSSPSSQRPLAAQSLPRFGAAEKHVDAELIAATDAIVPGQPLTVGLRLKHEHEWHTYWQVPGDSGLPTQIKWQLPAGFNAGAIDGHIRSVCRSGR